MTSSTSLWLDRPFDRHEDPFPENDRFQDVVVGAGLTGLTTAVLLARAGRRVGVLEARHVGAVATGNTTAKVSVLQGTKLQRLRSLQNDTRARAYVEANQAGLTWLDAFCEQAGVDTQRRDAIVYAGSASERRAAHKEYDAATALGLPVRWEETLDVPFPVHGATLLADQLQLDPVELLLALVAELRAHGGTVHEGQRVVGVSRAGQPTVEVDTGRVLQADNVILATGSPILDRALTFAKVEAKRSYLLSYTGADVPQGMFLSAGSDTRSLRDVPGPGGTFLVGGSGHSVGRTASEREHVERLRDWAGEFFPDAKETHVWSAQDYSPFDGLPLTGRLPLGLGRIYYATGYDKWGMTNAVAAANDLSAQVLGLTRPGWATAMDRHVPGFKATLRATLMNAKVGAAASTSMARAEISRVPEHVPEGTGYVGREHLLPAGTSRVDGEDCQVRAICTHLGGTLRWNDQEKSWDCPLHGSRFAADGQVLEGPATRPLLRRDTGEATA